MTQKTKSCEETSADMMCAEATNRVLRSGGVFPQSTYRGLLHLGEEVKIITSEAPLSACTK